MININNFYNPALFIFLTFLTSMWGSFVIKFYVSNRENYGHQKINLIVHVKINEKSWILKTVYVKHLFFFFSDFLKFLGLINLQLFLSQATCLGIWLKIHVDYLILRYINAFYLLSTFMLC